jgi:hypothetical protein
MWYFVLLFGTAGLVDKLYLELDAQKDADKDGDVACAKYIMLKDQPRHRCWPLPSLKS